MPTYRVTDSDVREIITAAAGRDLTPFIAGAEMVVNGVVVPLGYTDTELFEIERWVAAYLYQSSFPVKRINKIGAAMQEYAIQIGEGLASTPAGRQVLLLDYKGAFNAGKDPTRKVKVVHLGRNTCRGRWFPRQWGGL